MTEHIQPDDRYPRWNRTWQEKLSEVDDRIVDYFRDAGEWTENTAADLKDRISSWFDKQNLEPETRAEWEKAKSDAKLFAAQVDNRVTHLVQDGKIKVNRAMKNARD